MAQLIDPLLCPSVPLCPLYPIRPFIPFPLTGLFSPVHPPTSRSSCFSPYPSSSLPCLFCPNFPLRYLPSFSLYPLSSLHPLLGISCSRSWDHRGCISSGILPHLEARREARRERRQREVTLSPDPNTLPWGGAW